MKDETLDTAIRVKRGELRLKDIPAAERDAVHDALGKPGLLAARARDLAFRQKSHTKPNPVRMRAS